MRPPPEPETAEQRLERIEGEASRNREHLRQGLIAMIVAGVLFLLGGVLTLWQIDQERDDRIEAVANFSVELRNGLVASCQKNGNPLRQAVQGLLEEEIRQSRPGLLQKFFPQIPPQLLESIIEKQIEHKEDVIAEIEPLNCETLYPAVGPKVEEMEPVEARK